ncbi:hypothetical protein Adt_23446 [Abeliophyllum distichum]|uniref:Uncharacterized protein n=1 Tax=Abeliophyllum distichum TaxID=126358 RepID=A0ABD1SBQ7_9LAMI
MADVMSHRGDGVEDPPQQPPHRLDSTCEFGEIHHALVLPFMENEERTMQPIWNNTKYFTCLVGNQVRFTTPSCYHSWTEVPEEQRARLRSIIKSYFDPQGDQSLDEYWVVCAAVDRLVADRYHDYNLKAHNHLKAHGPSRPYGEMSVED